MSLSSTPFAGPFTTQLVKQSSATASPSNNVRGGGTTIYLVRVDNSANPSQNVYLHLYNNAAPTVGTTSPDVTLLVNNADVFETIWLTGEAFGTALSFACTLAGGLGGSASPTNPVIVEIACS